MMTSPCNDSRNNRPVWFHPGPPFSTLSGSVVAAGAALGNVGLDWSICPVTLVERGPFCVCSTLSKQTESDKGAMSSMGRRAKKAT